MEEIRLGCGWNHGGGGRAPSQAKKQHEHGLLEWRSPKASHVTQRPGSLASLLGASIFTYEHSVPQGPGWLR